MNAKLLDREQFLNVIEHTPLVSIDLVIRSPQGRVLMGERLNRPAQGYWFVPGGRICKQESLAQAFRRISQSELEMTLEIADARLLGAFTHLYDDNFADAPGITTHYVALGYQVDLQLDLADLPKQQHQGYRWIGADSDLKVHPNSQAYFPYLR